MHHWAAARTIVGAMTLIVGLACGSLLTAAQEAPPPDVGSTIVEDTLLQRGVLDRGGCPTGLNTNRFTAEGYRLAVTGNCFADRPSPSAFQRFSRLNVPDGEIQLEARAVTDISRIEFGFAFRMQQNFDRYAARLLPATGSVQIVKFVGEQSTVLAERSDLGQFLADWTTIGVRTQGSRFWLLLNNQPVLTASDSSYGDGSVLVAINRLGDPGDSQESALIVRNLRVSQLATGDVARAPKYEPFPSPPPLGEFVLEDPLTQAGALGNVSCPTGLAGAEFVGEGYLLKARGKCNQADDSANISLRLQGLTIPDGEVKLDLRVVNGDSRVRFFLQTRRQANNRDNYYVAFEPRFDLIHLLKIRGSDPAVVLDQLNGVSDFLNPGSWNTIALRLQGPRLWVLVNEEPILTAADPDLESGGVSLQLRRTGSADDDQEAAVVIRNLRVSRLADGDPSRMPVYQRP